MLRPVDEFIILTQEMEEKYGVQIEYVKQYGNGSYCWFYTKDNYGAGMAVGVKGFKDALNEVKDFYIKHKTELENNTWNGYF